MTKIKDNTCKQCAKTFSTNWYLARHIETVHDIITDKMPPNASNITSATLDLSYQSINSEIDKEIDSGYKSEAA